MTILLDVKGVTKRYGGLTANSDITFDVNQGEILGIIGPNGAGKSTLFDLITGFQPLDAGRVMLDGHDITGLRPDKIASRGVARTFQKLKPFPDLTVTENVCWPRSFVPSPSMPPLVPPSVVKSSVTVPATPADAVERPSVMALLVPCGAMSPVVLPLVVTLPVLLTTEAMRFSE